MTLKNIIHKLGNTENAEEFILNLCNKIRNLNPKKAIKIYDYLIAYTIENGLNKVYPNILYNYSWIQYDLGNFDVAIKLNLKAITLFKEQADDDGVLSSIALLIGLYSNCQRFDKAIEYANIGIDLAESTGNFQRLCSIKSTMGILYLEIEQYSEAEDIFKKALRLPNVGNKTNELSMLVNLSECQIERKLYDEALINLKKALPLAKQHRISVVPYIFFLSARIYTETDIYDLAEEKFEESIKLCIDGNYSLFLNDAYIFWSDLALKQKKYTEIINKLKNIEENIVNVSSLRNIRRLYKNLHLSYRHLNNYENAYYYLEKLNNLENDFSNRKLESIKIISKTVQNEENKIYKTLFNETEALYTIGQKLASSLKLENIYSILEKEVNTLFDFDILSIGIINNNSIKYELSVEFGKRVEIVSSSLDKICLGIYSVKNKQDILINDISKDCNKYLHNYNELLKYSSYSQTSSITTSTQSMIFVPIIASKDVIGILTIQSYCKNKYDLNDVNKLKIISNYLGIALVNSHYYNEIQYNANYDMLTKIYNRRTVLDKIQKSYTELKLLKEMAITNISSNDSKLTINEDNKYLVLIDIDNFKKINDTYGHQTGDDVLISISSTLRKSIGDNDVLGRYGGEEFIALINDCNNNYLETLDNIRKNIENLFIKYTENNVENNINVTASFGVAKLNPSKMTLKEIINIADKALYKAKTLGKNRVIIAKDI